MMDPLSDDEVMAEEKECPGEEEEMPVTVPVPVQEEISSVESPKVDGPELPLKSDRFYVYKKIEAAVERRISLIRQLPDTRRTSFFSAKKEEVDNSWIYKVGCRDRQIKYLKYELMPMVSSCLMLELQDLQDSSMECPDKVEEPIECITMFISNILLLSKGNYDARLRSFVKNACVKILEEAYQDKPEVPTVDSRNLYFWKKEDTSKQKKDVIIDLDEVIVQQTSYTPKLTVIKQATMRFEHIETCIATDILRSFIETEQGSILPKATDHGRRKRIVIRTLQIGSVGLVVGGLFAFTGGLAAPAFVAAISAFGIGTGSAVFATLTTTTALAALFGVSGGGIAVHKMKKRTAQLTEWRIRNESKALNKEEVQINGLHATVAVSGWLLGKVDFQRAWGIMPTDPAIIDQMELLQRFFAVHGPEKMRFCKALLKGEELKQKEIKKAKKTRKEDPTTNTENYTDLWTTLDRHYGRDPDHLLPFETIGEESVLPIETERLIAATLQKDVLPNSMRLGEIYVNNSMLTKMEAMNAEFFGLEEDGDEVDEEHDDGDDYYDDDGNLSEEKLGDDDHPAVPNEMLMIAEKIDRQTSCTSLDSMINDESATKGIRCARTDDHLTSPSITITESKLFDNVARAEELEQRSEIDNSTSDHDKLTVPNEIGGNLTDHVEMPSSHEEQNVKYVGSPRSTAKEEDLLDKLCLADVILDDIPIVTHETPGLPSSEMVAEHKSTGSGLSDVENNAGDLSVDMEPISLTSTELSVTEEGRGQSYSPLLAPSDNVATISPEGASKKSLDDNMETKGAHIYVFEEQDTTCADPINMAKKEDDASFNSKGSKESDKTLDSREELAKRDHDVVVWDWQASFGGELYTITWETDLLTRLCRVVNLMFAEIGTNLSKQLAQATVIGGVVAAVHIPSALATCLNVIDDPYQLISFRSDFAGIELAKALLHSEEHRPVSLVGYSFGSRVIFSCLQELARHQQIWEKQQKITREKESSNKGATSTENEEPKRVGWRMKRAAKARAARRVWINYSREPASIIEDVCFIGMPRLVDVNEWVTCREIVGGRVINSYSQSDFFLNYLFQIRTWKGVHRVTAGTCPIQGVDGIENYDVTSFVTTHGRYPLVVPQILQQVGFGEPSYILVKEDGTSVV